MAHSPLYQNGGLSLQNTASLYCIQVLYTTHVEMALSLSDWRPLFTVYSCYIQLI